MPWRKLQRRDHPRCEGRLLIFAKLAALVAPVLASRVAKGRRAMTFCRRTFCDPTRIMATAQIAIKQRSSDSVAQSVAQSARKLK